MTNELSWFLITPLFPVRKTFQLSQLVKTATTKNTESNWGETKQTTLLGTNNRKLKPTETVKRNGRARSRLLSLEQETGLFVQKMGDGTGHMNI
jgi:hypothetical protein